MYESIKKIIIDQVLKQGFSVTLMFCAMFYLYLQISDFKHDIKLSHQENKICNEENKQLLKDYSFEMKSIIIRNTQVFEKIENRIK